MFPSGLKLSEESGVPLDEESQEVMGKLQHSSLLTAHIFPCIHMGPILAGLLVGEENLTLFCHTKPAFCKVGRKRGQPSSFYLLPATSSVLLHPVLRVLKLRSSNHRPLLIHWDWQTGLFTLLQSPCGYTFLCCIWEKFSEPSQLEATQSPVPLLLGLGVLNVQKKGRNFPFNLQQWLLWWPL